jgi:demethylmenaquinone methyltransferase/2-methoxy-6-polyprenyl-1,4-benzoquinol methylase
MRAVVPPTEETVPEVGTPGPETAGMSSPADGPVPTSLPEGDEKRRAVRTMFDTIAPRYDRVNRLMTFGLDRRWRRRAVASLDLDPGAVVADVACGTGDLCVDLERAGYRPLGFDLSSGMLRHAHCASPLVHGDGLDLPVRTGALDGVVSGFALRNVVGLEPLLVELARVLRPGGRVALLDVSSPTQPLLRAGHGLYFGRVVPLVGSALSDGAAYRYLPRSVAYLPPVAEMLALLRSCGFVAVERHQLSGGITQLLTGTRAPR